MSDFDSVRPGADQRGSLDEIDNSIMSYVREFDRYK
jgi:hypothetical protein